MHPCFVSFRPWAASSSGGLEARKHPRLTTLFPFLLSLYFCPPHTHTPVHTYHTYHLPVSLLKESIHPEIRNLCGHRSCADWPSRIVATFSCSPGCRFFPLSPIVPFRCQSVSCQSVALLLSHNLPPHSRPALASRKFLVNILPSPLFLQVSFFKKQYPIPPYLTTPRMFLPLHPKILSPHALVLEDEGEGARGFEPSRIRTCTYIKYSSKDGAFFCC